MKQKVSITINNEAKSKYNIICLVFFLYQYQYLFFSYNNPLQKPFAPYKQQITVTLFAPEIKCNFREVHPDGISSLKAVMRYAS